MIPEGTAVMIRLVSRAVSIATRAGAEARRIAISGQLGVIDKGIQDFQTEADRVVQRMIVGSLSKHFPQTTIVAEEDLPEDNDLDANLIVDEYDERVLDSFIPSLFLESPEEDFTIWVDPLDGTSEFVRGILEPVTILIGITYEGRTVAGIINQPFYKDSDGNMGRTMWGIVRVGVYGITKIDPPTDKLIITTSASHGNSTNEDAIAHLEPQEVIKVGGAGYKAILLLEGKAHVYLFASKGCKLWDTCAPEALLRSSYGLLTDICGETICYKKREDQNYTQYMGVLATDDADIHAKCCKSMLAQAKETLKAAV